MVRHSYYISQKVADYDYYTIETRADLISAYPDRGIWKFLKMVSIQYRKGIIDRKKVAIVAANIKRLWGIKYRILSDRNIIFLPTNNNIVENAIYAYPQLIAIVGNRNSGKTITSWTLALKFLDLFSDGRIYVYGDIDGIAESLIRIKPYLERKIIIRKNNELPPLGNTPKLALYNELIKPAISKRATSSENLDLNFQALRSRHRNTWVIYNVIRYSLLESTLRETSDIQMYKWMSPTLLKNVLGILPRPLGEIIKITSKLKVNESLITLPIQGKGTYYGIYITHPPEYLLRAHKEARKNKLLMMTGNEREAATMQKIMEMKELGKSGEEISRELEKNGVKLTARAINIRYKKFKERIESGQ